MIKWKGVIFFIVLFLIVGGISIGLWYAFKTPESAKQETTIVKYYEIMDFSATENYLGTTAIKNGNTVYTYDVIEMLGLDSTYTISSSDSKILTGSVVKFSYSGDYSNTTITVSKDDVFTTYKVVKGYNIREASDFYATYSGDFINGNAYIGGNVIIQSDINMADAYQKYPLLKNKNMWFYMKYNFYGNGHKISFDGCVTTKDNTFFEFFGKNTVLQDVIITGLNVSEGEEIDLNDLYDVGTIVGFGINDNLSSTTVKNCIITNSRRNVFIKNSNVSFSGCMFNHAADANVSIKTNNVAPSNISFENSVFANSIVASIVNFCPNTVDEENYCTIDFKGFNDFYAWKNIDKVVVASTKDPNAGIYNSIIESSFNSISLNSDLVTDDDYNKYINMAILVLCSAGGDNKNELNVTGLDSEDVQKQKVPLATAVSLILTTCDVYGYSNVDYIGILDTPADNVYLYYQMRYGR